MEDGAPAKDSKGQAFDLGDFLHQDWGSPNTPTRVDQFEDLEDYYSVTDLLLEYLGSLARRRDLLDRKELLQGSNPSPPTLGALTVRTIIQTLKTAKKNETLEHEFVSLFSRLPENDIRSLFEDPQMPYVILRRFLLWRKELPAVYEGASTVLVDIDEMVLQHERYLRSLAPSTLDQQMTVTFDDLIDIETYPNRSDPITDADKDFISFTRQEPPYGGLELLDHWRVDRLKINVESYATFAADFSCATTGVLQGLDWSNVLASGDAVMHVLLKAGLGLIASQIGLNSIISLHLWGLNTAAEALQKIANLYDVWSTRMAIIGGSFRCLKRRNAIYFLSEEDGQSVKINLKIFKNPLDILLQERIDLYGIGFDGSQVFMLPSCARALETGYNTFSSRYLYDDLISGYYRGSLIDSYVSDTLFLSPYYSPLENGVDIFKLHHLAALGFGLRILPSYSRSLCDGIEVPRLGGAGSPKPPLRWAANRGQPGLKILKRLEFMGRRWILCAHPKDRYAFTDLPLRTLCEKMRDVPYENWESAYKEANASWSSAFSQATDPDDTFNPSSHELEIQFFRCASRLMRHPNFRPSNLFCFETFIRQCQLSQNLRRVPNANLVAQEAPYDWEDSRDEHVVSSVDQLSFWLLRGFVCARVGIPFRADTWHEYLTRRIRSKHCGADLAGTLDKQIVVPVIIPYDLEQRLRQMVDEVRTESGADIPEFLIAIHEAGAGRGIIPDYTETRDSKIGNLKYWVLSNEMLIRGLHPKLDDVFHVLDVLYQMFLSYKDRRQTAAQQVETRIDTPFFKNRLGDMLRRRVPVDLDDSFPDGSKADTELVMVTGASAPLYPHCAITAKEALKFRKWVFGGPDVPVHYEKGVPKYPFPDELFWKEENERKHSEEEIPQWEDVEEGRGMIL